MAISALSTSVAATIAPRASLAREASTTSLLSSKGGVSNDISLPSVSIDVLNDGGDTAGGDSLGQGGGPHGGGPKGGGGASGSSTDDNALEELIAAAKRRVQPQVGVSGADKVVGKDGSIDYKKLADLIAQQQAQAQAQAQDQQTKPMAALATPLLDLFA